MLFLPLMADSNWTLSPLGPAWLSVAVAAGLLLAVVIGTLALVRKKVSGRWTAFLGLLRLAAWAVFVLMLLQPTRTTSRVTTPGPELLVLIDTSASMGRMSVAGKTTMLDEGVSSLREGELGRALASRYQVSWYTFAGQAQRRDVSELATLKPAGTTTRLAAALQDAWTTQFALGKRPSRILLVTDGHDHGDGDPLAGARGWGVPVDVLAPSAAVGEPVWSLTNPQASRRVLLGSETQFRLTLRTEPPVIEDRKTSLRFFEDGQLVREIPFVVKAGQSEHGLVVAHRPAAVGVKAYEFRLKAPGLGDAKGELVAKRTVRVVDEAFEILLLEDAWRWEYKYLHRLFEDDPSFRFTALLPRGKGGFAQFGSPDRRVNLVGFPQSRGELEGFDLFVLGDVAPVRWPQGVAAELARQVTQEGRSLVVIAGPNLGQLAEMPELHDLLPVELTPASGRPVTGPIEVRVRPESADSAFFVPRASEAKSLPALDQVYPASRKRPGAAVLVEAVKQRNAYGPLIVMAEQTVGKGRVLFIGTDTLWKWHTLAETDGPTPYAQFWRQALRTLAPERTRRGAVDVWLTPSRSQGIAKRQQELDVEVRSDRPLAGSKIEAYFVHPAGERSPVSLAVDAGQPWHSRGEWVPTEPGTYQLQATVFVDGKAVAESSTPVQIDAETDEGREVGLDDSLLTRLTIGTGGQRLDPKKPETWPTPSPGGVEPRIERSSFDFWGSFTLLLLLCVLLGVDWFVRVFQGVT